MSLLDRLLAHPPRRCVVLEVNGLPKRRLDPRLAFDRRSLDSVQGTTNFLKNVVGHRALGLKFTARVG